MTEETAGNGRSAGKIEFEIASYLPDRRSGIVERNIAFAFSGFAEADREGVVPDLCYIRTAGCRNGTTKRMCRKK